MRFTKISIKNDGVELVREITHANGDTQHIELEADGQPLPSFRDALQAFRAYVLGLLPITLDKDVALTITSLSLSEDKHGLRGLIVCGLVPVEGAYDKPLVLNTPLVREPGQNASDDACVLSDETLALIKLAEEEATKFYNGERVQTEMFNREDAEQSSRSENSDNFDERAAAASAASTRKPRAKRKGRESAADAEVKASTWNPDKTEQLTDAKLRQLLLSVERDVPEDAVARWSSSERDAAQRWGEAEQRRLAGQVQAGAVPKEPKCVKRDATPALSAEEWTPPDGPHVDDDGVQAIHAAAERGD